MRKALSIVALCAATVSMAQSQDSIKTTDVNVSLAWYASASISVSSGEGFSEVAYPSIEVGVSVETISYGLNVGRRDLANHGEKERPSNYYVEGKVAKSWPIGEVDGFVLAGFGFVPDADHYLIEYGGGLIWPTDWVNVALQISNWDRNDYLSLGLIRNF